MKQFKIDEKYHLDIFVGYVTINIFDVRDNIVTYELENVQLTKPISEIDREHLSYIYYLRGLFMRRQARIKNDENGNEYISISLPGYKREYTYGYDIKAGQYGVLRKEVE